jgi:hypothetical protein
MRNPNNRNVVITFNEFRERADKLRINYETLTKKWEERTLTDFEYVSVILLMSGIESQLSAVENALSRINTLYSAPKSRLTPIRHKLGKGI